MKCGLKNLTVRAMWQVRGGNEDGANLRSADYSVNSKNQYTSRDVPPYIEVQGIANVNATVTVEGSSSGVYRHGEYFRKELYDDNSSAPQYPTIDVDTDVTSPVSGEKYLPQDAESFGYDSDGNLTSDGRWTYTWDAENRLIKMERNVSSPSGARQKLEFEYDWQGRRIRKKFFTYSSGWQEQSDTIFLYDGWNLIAELNANSSNAKVRTYIWGLDLSGSEQGAGGVGGLLKETDYTSGTTHHFVAHDGNGNVVALVKATDGTYTARYEYGPFGESIRGSGTMAYNNPFRFSTKYTDNESGLVYYGFRYYNPSMGRWLNRDPMEESGGKNLYAFIANDAINRQDFLGMYEVTIEEMTDVLHNIARARHKFRNCARVVAFLNCVEAKIWCELQQNIDRRLVEKSCQLSSQWLYESDLPGGRETDKFMRFLVDKMGLPEDYVPWLKPLEVYRNAKDAVDRYVVQPVQTIGDLSKGDVVGSVLSIGKYLSGVLSKTLPPQANAFKQWIQWYAESYTATVDTLASFKYRMGAGQFGGKLRNALILGDENNCLEAELLFAGGIGTPSISGTGCEQKHLGSKYDF